MPGNNQAARAAVDDAVVTGLGQAVCIFGALVFSIFVPRVLGAAMYGEWMLYRGMAIFWLPLMVLGDREVMAAFYVPFYEKGEDRQAGLLFKSLMVLRLFLLPLVLGGGLLLLFTSSSLFRTPQAAFCLMVTLVAKTGQYMLQTLLFGRRRMGYMAFLEGIQTILLPLFVLLAYRRVGAVGIPWAAAMADLLLFGVALVLTPRKAVWTSGWPALLDVRHMFRYAFVVALAGNIIMSLNNLLYYLMNIWGYAPDVIGRVGLVMRCAGVAQTGLMAIATALMPALMSIHQQHGRDKMFQWQDVVSRFGLALILLLAGNIRLFGPWAVRWVWGPEFADVSPLLFGGLMAVAPVWLGAQWSRQFLLERRSQVYLISSLIYGG
ncbi:MAG: hypothetical protein LBN38_03750, partial [Verrucomicrobiota bacterium]|nr:hypothetical protein [Verrucomicrobiota bacterium]